MHTQTEYKGPERRRRRMFVTKNTEYHFHDDVCVAVRDRGTGRFLLSHLAMNRTLSGAVRVLENGTAIPTSGPPGVGQALYFHDGGLDLVTSLCREIARPAKRTVQSYPD